MLESNAIAGIDQQPKKFLCSGPKLQPAGGGLSQVVPVDSECCHESACRMSPWFHFEAFLLCWPGSGGQCSISERLVACVKPVEINVDSFCKAERSKELSRKKSTFSCEPQGTPPSLGCTWHSRLIGNRSAMHQQLQEQ